ncbi:Hsp20/alpha crystallin family protein [Halomonas campisalis]|uniref:Hsp20/alpha crystallin family protein n=1 Tax=Billgrantia campisalis TaxID=74661 RepID=A0ABS9PAV2_9GAMM|nr:Hsp20/alpha crystallin family protein [Halomonas campisalis]MCG6658892.1 Hsp20/alpha crystallin family protein [Halomonas campisalis]MDR5864808.1 Hsp20/alpha crystallin family protein [Halomonas campisalis]
MFEDLRRFDTGPFQGLDWVRQLMDGFFPESGIADIRSVPRGSYPMINVGHTDDGVYVYVFAAGLSAADLEVSLQDNVLTLRGKRETVAPEQKEGEAKRPYFRRERFSGEFARSIALPDGLNADLSEARFRNGVFEIHLPKREELKPRRIEIKAA